jgi:GDPmannose 4,6-dehydratase
MLQQDKPQDFVISTGSLISLEEFVGSAFEYVNLNWRDHVIQDEKLFRPADASISFGDSTKAEIILGWSAKTKGKDLVSKMFHGDFH